MEWVYARPLGTTATAVAMVVLGTLVVLLARLRPETPGVLREVAATAILAGLSWCLAMRSGGRPVLATGVATGLAIAAFVSDWEPLLAGGSVAVAVVAACLAILATQPAATVTLALREALVAGPIALAGGIGALGFGEDARPVLDQTRFSYVVLGLSLLGAFALVYRLGAGLNGLGRRGWALGGAAVLFLIVGLAYSEALAQWGSRDLIEAGRSLRETFNDRFGGVPHPLVAGFGLPALLWGVFTRARRRQGWWVCAFGVAATAPFTTRLMAESLEPRPLILGGLYTLVIGVAVGFAVIRLEQILTGSRGRRARRSEEAVAHRPEPSRWLPLH